MRNLPLVDVRHEILSATALDVFVVRDTTVFSRGKFLDLIDPGAVDEHAEETAATGLAAKPDSGIRRRPNT